MSRRLLVMLMCGALALPASGSLAAQQPEPSQPAAPDSARRAQLEARLRQGIAQVVRRQLQLTDAQFDQLRAVNDKYEPQRRQLVRQEQYLRLSLRAEMSRGDEADQSKVASYLDGLTTVQEQRLQIFRTEQKDLAKFLSPVQRAKYAVLQDQLRKRITQMRQRQLERMEQRRARPLRGPFRP